MVVHDSSWDMMYNALCRYVQGMKDEKEETKYGSN